MSRFLTIVALCFLAGSEARLLRKKSLNLKEGKFVVALDKDMKTKMLVQTQSKIVDTCSGVTCGDLKCPVGFFATEYPGHCCPYCVNPNIKIEKLVKGATGEFGGETSLHCPDVWCFPTLCTKPVSQPGSGECCETCPAL